MRRRDFIALTSGAGAAAAFPRLAFGQRAQQLPRIAIVRPTVTVDQMTENGDPETAGFLKELRRLGFVEGGNVLIERWSGNAAPNTYASAAQAAVASKPDVIFVNGTVMSQTVVAATKVIPIVYSVGSDGTNIDLVSNISHPGGNVTGVAGSSGGDIALEEQKRMSLIHEALPSLKRIACLSSAAGWETIGRGLMEAGPQLGLEVIGPVIAAAPIAETSYRDIFKSLAQRNVEMIQVLTSPEANTFGTLIGSIAASSHMPGISANANFVDGGGLMAYGVNREVVGRSAAGQVALILGGKNPGDLPVILPQVFDFVVSLSAAKALAIELPAALVAAATDVRQ